MHNDIVSLSLRELDAVALATNATVSMKRGTKEAGGSYCQKLWMEPSGGDLILPDSVDECHIVDNLSQTAVAL